MSSRPLLFEILKVPPAALGITKDQRLVLVQLIDAYNPSKNGAEVWPSLRRLADLTGMNIKTARAARRALEVGGLIKVALDPGKPDVCTLNVELIRALADPYQKREGCLSTPLPDTGGDPYQIREGTPTADGTRMTNTTKNDQLVIRRRRVSDGDQQRKLALPGVVEGGASKPSPTHDEQPTREKQNWRAERDKALASAGGK